MMEATKAIAYERILLVGVHKEGSSQPAQESPKGSAISSGADLFEKRMLTMNLSDQKLDNKKTILQRTCELLPRNDPVKTISETPLTGSFQYDSTTVREPLPPEDFPPEILPNAVQDRLDYINKAKPANALINNSEIKNLLENLAQSNNFREHYDIRNQIIEKIGQSEYQIQAKSVQTIKYPHIENLSKNLNCIKALIRGKTEHRFKIDEFLLPSSLSTWPLNLNLNNIITTCFCTFPGSRAAEEPKIISSLIEQLTGLWDALNQLRHDMILLSSGQVTEDTISIKRYFDLLNPKHIKYSINDMPKLLAEARLHNISIDSVDRHFSEEVKARTKNSLISHDVIQMILFQRLEETIKFKEKNGIISAISRNSAQVLSEYLSTNNIKSLFLPMAGNGFFAKQLEKAEIRLSCYDICPASTTYTDIKEADALKAIDLFNTPETGISIGNTAMVIASPAPTSIIKITKGKKESIATKHYLPELFNYWLQSGGEKVLIISVATKENDLFSPAYLDKYGIRLQPLEPPLPATVFAGLAEQVGICGFYDVVKK